MDEIEKSFAKTSQIIFGTELSPLLAYVPYLERGLPFSVVKKPSKISKNAVYLVPHPAYLSIDTNISDIGEALEIGKKSVTPSEAESLSLFNAKRTLSKISTTCPNTIFGENFDTVDSACYGPTQHCFRIAFTWWSKYSSCCYDVRTSSHVHGCSDLDDCNFCIRCRQSSKLQRCFEVDQSSNCSDCYLSHNIEGCHDCIFCFNAKNLKNAIGNREYPREEYLSIKKELLQSIMKEILHNKRLKMDIYSIGLLHGKK